MSCSVTTLITCSSPDLPAARQMSSPAPHDAKLASPTPAPGLFEEYLDSRIAVPAVITSSTTAGELMATLTMGFGLFAD